MTSRILVGYTATKSGADAVALGARLAAATGSALSIVIVLPDDTRSLVTPSNAGYSRHLHATAKTWLAQAAAKVPPGVVHREHVRYAESFAEGLSAAATELGAAAIVVGPAAASVRGRHQLGSTTAELLHSSPVPVVLTPKGERKNGVTGVARLTVALGARPGADALLTFAVDFATSTSASMRLLSLITVDLPTGVETGVIRIAGAAHAEEVLARVQWELPAATHAEVQVARGDSIADAVSELSWLPGEIVMVGSSRLAQPHRLFLGSTASKMLRELPVPMIIVPRTLDESMPRLSAAAPHAQGGQP